MGYLEIAPKVRVLTIVSQLINALINHNYIWNEGKIIYKINKTVYSYNWNHFNNYYTIFATNTTNCYNIFHNNWDVNPSYIKIKLNRIIKY